MYADHVASGSKRSLIERLSCRSSPANPKRKRHSFAKWKHDLHEDVKGPQVSKAEVISKDLRLKLQKRGSQQAYQGGKEPGVRDLREKLSGTMNSLPTCTDPPKFKAAPESTKSIKKSAPSTGATLADTKKISAPTTSSKKSQQKSELSADGLLRSLGLEKYSIIFQAEEVDMAALMHMTDEDLKALGVPMGPRKKILVALDSRV